MIAKDVAKRVLGKDFNEETYCDRCWSMRIISGKFFYCPKHTHYRYTGDPVLKDERERLIKKAEEDSKLPTCKWSSIEGKMIYN